MTISLEVQEIPVDLRRGVYWFRGINGKPTAKGEPTWAFRPGYYRLVGIARNYRAFQKLVVYESLNRWDRGLHLAGISDWVRDFEKVHSGWLKEHKPGWVREGDYQDVDDPAPAEKVADLSER